MCRDENLIHCSYVPNKLASLLFFFWKNTLTPSPALPQLLLEPPNFLRKAMFSLQDSTSLDNMKALDLKILLCFHTYFPSIKYNFVRT